MSLLTLKDIGKIYVSEGNVAVGIRGVNLSFDRGEFVAVTGKSGSGKSTLLNVISGMDTYEEGDLLIEGQSTAHYLQPDWENYRQKYISFIFQDYNIIESYTVLQNVELALMHIADRRERRRRAVELLTRVGMANHLRQKGSRLSGGQKQRTVIARALAKDSPIILADEPTGNLDSVTSEEIIQLLREVSRDKLLIMVTHNFEQVEHCATRHIRIFDGTVESDHVLEPTAPPPPQPAAQEERQVKKPSDLRNGITLGTSIFTSRPRLSLFLCLLMLIGTMGMFLVTAVSGNAAGLFSDYRMFRHINGRLVLARQNGAVIGEEELQSLAAELGAQGVLHCDALLDEGGYYIFLDDGSAYTTLQYTYGEDFGSDVIGRYPEARDEVLLYLPIAYQPKYGKDSLAVQEIELEGMAFRVVGVKYYYDTNQSGQVLLTEEGFRLITAAHYLLRNVNLQVSVDFNQPDYPGYSFSSNTGCAAEDVEPGKIYISDPDYRQRYKQYLADAAADPDLQMTVTVRLDTTYYNYNYDFTDSSSTRTYSRIFGNGDLTDTGPSSLSAGGALADNPFSAGGVVFSPELLLEMADEFLGESYRQASLFFSDDAAADAAAEKLADRGYIAVPSDTTYTPDPMETILSTFEALFAALIWLAAILFLAFFIYLCSSRTLDAFRGDMAIMRSMGIRVRVIRLGMYVRMLLALLPAYVLVVLAANICYRSPLLSKYLSLYLYPWQYALLFVGMLLLTLRVTHKQIRRLFGQSVKKSLKGGTAE